MADYLGIYADCGNGSSQGMTSGEVAKMLGLSEQRVRQAAPKYAKKQGRNYWWTDKAIESLRERMGKTGRPSNAAEENPRQR